MTVKTSLQDCKTILKYLHAAYAWAENQTLDSIRSRCYLVSWKAVVLTSISASLCPASTSPASKSPAYALHLSYNKRLLEQFYHTTYVYDTNVLQ